MFSGNATAQFDKPASCLLVVRLLLYFSDISSFQIYFSYPYCSNGPITSTMPSIPLLSHKTNKRSFFSLQHTASPYLQGIPTMTGFGPYLASSSPVMTVGVNDCMTSQLAGVVPQQMLAAQKIPRTDRLEVRLPTGTCVIQC